jgi:hypothetical protein
MNAMEVDVSDALRAMRSKAPAELAEFFAKFEDFHDRKCASHSHYPPTRPQIVAPVDGQVAGIRRETHSRSAAHSAL